VALEDIRRPYAHGVGVSRVVGNGDCLHVALPLSARNRRVRRTLELSCEAPEFARLRQLQLLVLRPHRTPA
jgi:hypothetical protein